MSKYAPPGALAADAMPEGFLTDQNTVAIIPEGESGYYILPFIATPALQERYRTTINVKGADGKGGLFIGDPLTMAASCENKPAAWEVMKWLAGSVESQRYNFASGGNLPVIKDSAAAAPEIAKLVDADAILGQMTSTDNRYPGHPRSRAGRYRPRSRRRWRGRSRPSRRLSRPRRRRPTGSRSRRLGRRARSRTTDRPLRTLVSHAGERSPDLGIRLALRHSRVGEGDIWGCGRSRHCT